MKFKYYKHIDGVWQTKTMDYLILKGFDDPEIEWCVTEKIHGTNFSFWCDGNEILPAKRNSFLPNFTTEELVEKPAGSKFFQYELILPEMNEKTQKIWDYLVETWFGEEITELAIYGEMFGGYYPHEKVEKVLRVKRVQKGVHYCPDVKFYCYDIMINRIFQPMDFVVEVCKMFDILHADILFRGTFEECMKYPNEFPTKIPEKFGLPQLDKNVCEGVVLKPVYPETYADGSRVILKSKNAKFAENQKEPKSRDPYKSRQVTLSEKGKEVLEKISEFINENRLNNVLSKFGEFTKKQFRDVWQLFKDDVYEDFNREHNLNVLDDDDLKKLDKLVGRLCTDVWRPVFVRGI